MVAHNPLHGSGRAGFPHPALASGDDAHAAQRKRMIETRQRQPAGHETPQALQGDAASLVTARKRSIPKPAHLKPEGRERGEVHGHAVVAKVPTDDRAQPLAHFRGGILHAPPKVSFHLLQLGLQPLAHRQPQHRKHSVASLPHADMREAEKVERLRFSLSASLPVADRKWTKLQQPRLLGMQFELELTESLLKLRPEPLGIRPDLKAQHDIVRESHDDHVAARSLPTPRLDPQVKNIMEVDVRQQRRCTSALGRPFLHSQVFPVLQHAGVQPLLDEPHDAPVRDPMLDEPDQPFVGDPIEKALDVQVEHPVHLLRQQSRVERIQRPMRAAPRSEPVGEAEKVGFVDGVQHLDRRTLDNLVFQRRYAERPLPPIGLGDVHPTNRLGPVRSSFQPRGKVLEILFQFLTVMPPRLPVHARRGFPLQAEVGPAKRFQVVDVVQERGEPQLPILLGCLTYPLQRAGRVGPARCPARVLLRQVPFGQTPSLRPLRPSAYELTGVVRGLLRYYGSVRLPLLVHHRRVSLDFPTRSEAPMTSDGQGISRFPCEVLPNVRGVSDRAGLRGASRYRRPGCCLPPLLTASASRSWVTRLNTRPARSPVNASSPPSRVATHDSGPLWVANPSTYDSFIHYTSPV